MHIHTVRPGESLHELSLRYRQSPDKLARLNGLYDPSRLAPGMALYIPSATPKPRRGIELMGLASPGLSAAALAFWGPWLSFFCPGPCCIGADGALYGPPGSAMCRRAAEYGAGAFLSISNTGAQGGYSPAIAHGIFSDSGALLDCCLAELEERGLQGVYLDFQYIHPFERKKFTGFLRRLSEALHERGYWLTAALAPKTAADIHMPLCAGQDYSACGEYADRCILLCYDWGRSLEAVAPADKIRPVLDYAVSEIPAGRLLLACSDMACSRNLPHDGSGVKLMANSTARNMAAALAGEVRYDSRSASCSFEYTDSGAMRHLVSYDDVRGYMARLSLAEEYSLAGISLHGLKRENPLLRSLLEEMFSPG